MKKIDFHTHIFPDTLAEKAISKLIACSPGSINYTDGTADGLYRSIKESGIYKSVLLPVATKSSQVHSINIDCKSPRYSEFICFGALHPELVNFQDEIDFLVNNKIKGIKFHPEYQNFYADMPSMFPMYEALSDAGLITVFHAGKDPGPFTCDHLLPSALKKIHHEFPKLKIVAAHLGGWKVWDDVEKILCGFPIWFDTAAVMGFIPDEQFIRIIRKHGVERILFATDSPWFDQKGTVNWIEKMDLTDSEKEMIFIKNALTLLNLTGE
jgi:uncharacterized protein